MCNFLNDLSACGGMILSQWPLVVATCWSCCQLDTVDLLLVGLLFYRRIMATG